MNATEPSQTKTEPSQTKTVRSPNKALIFNDDDRLHKAKMVGAQGLEPWTR